MSFKWYFKEQCHVGTRRKNCNVNRTIDYSWNLSTIIWSSTCNNFVTSHSISYTIGLYTIQSLSLLSLSTNFSCSHLHNIYESTFQTPTTDATIDLSIVVPIADLDATVVCFDKTGEIVVVTSKMKNKEKEKKIMRDVSCAICMYDVVCKKCEIFFVCLNFSSVMWLIRSNVCSLCWKQFNSLGIVIKWKVVSVSA